MRRSTQALLASLVLLPPVVAAGQAGLPYIEEETDPPPPPPPPDETPKSVEPVVPNIASRPTLFGLSPRELDERWTKRIERLHEGDTRTADAILKELVEAKEDSGWPNATTEGLATASEALTALEEGDTPRAVELGAFARRLAPDAPGTHLAEARIAWASAELGGSLRALGRALSASWSNPYALRMRLANVSVGLALAFMIAASLFALASVYRHFRSFRQTVGRVLPKGATRAQAGILVATVLFAPILMGLGPAWVILVWATVCAGYYGRGERIAACVVIVFLGTLPLTLPLIFSPLSYTGSRAHAAFLAATDIGAETAAARLAATSDLAPSEQFILGQRALWSGDVDRAAGWLQAASERDKSTPELYVSLGNVEYARGNLDRATDVYNFAIAQDAQNVMALFNLSRLKFSETEQQEAGELHRRANELDYATVERWSDEAKRIGPTFVVRPSVPSKILAQGRIFDPSRSNGAEDVWRGLAGGFSRVGFPIAAGVALLFVLLSGWRPRRPRKRDKDGAGALERIGQEIEIHRHQVRIARLQRILAVLFAGAGQLLSGRSVLGLGFTTVFLTSLMVLLSTAEVIPRLVPYDGGPKVFALMCASVVTGACYAASLWDTLTSER